ncbi:MAG: MmgE/PrpD family protein [Trebonia sp.]
MAPEPALAESIAAVATSAYRDGVPAAVATSVRSRVLDTLGICVASHRLETSRAAIEHVLAQGGTPQAHIVGVATLVPAALAAFANGVLAHSLDYDDTHLPSVLHPSATVIPAALAAAQAAGADGTHTVRAIAVGLEITVRLGMAGYDRALGNSVFYEHGQHATSICGALGASVSAALLLGLDEEGVRNTLGINASMASGIIEGNRTGGTGQRMHCGWAAQSALTAADLVARGFTGPPTVLEGRFGFFEAFLRGQANAEEVTDGLGTSWSVPGIFFKPYPANHFTHAAIDAGMALRARGVRPDDIASMRLGVPSSVVRTIGQPIEAKRAPLTGYQAQFSGPYAVVAGLLGGGGLGVGLDDFTDELAKDPRRRSLMARVEVVGDERCDAIFPAQFPAILTATLTDGSEVTAEVLANRGGPRRPLSDAELALKFRDCAGRYLDDDQIDTVYSRVMDLGEGPDAGAVLEPLAALASPAETA